MTLSAAGHQSQDCNRGGSDGAPWRIQKSADYRPHGQNPSVADALQLPLHLGGIVAIFAVEARERREQRAPARRAAVEAAVRTFGLKVQALHAFYPRAHTIAGTEWDDADEAVRGQAADKRVTGGERVQLQFGIVLAQRN